MDQGVINEIKGQADIRFAKAKWTLIVYYAVISLASMAATGLNIIIGRVFGNMIPGVSGLIKLSVHFLVMAFLVTPMMVGLKKGIKDLKNEDKIDGCIFYAFDSERYMKIVRGTIFYSAICASLFLLNYIDELVDIRVFGVIHTLSAFAVLYVMAFMLTFVENIIADDIETSPVEACSKSIKLMTGHQKDLLDLLLSYIRCIIITIFTCGLGMFYFAPLFNCATACMYERLKENA